MNRTMHSNTGVHTCLPLSTRLEQTTFSGCWCGGLGGIVWEKNKEQRMPLLTPIPPDITEPGSPSHSHQPKEGLKLQQRRLQISLHSPHMPDRGEERITGFLWTASLSAQDCSPAHQQITITAHKDMEERRRMWRERQEGDAALCWRQEDNRQIHLCITESAWVWKVVEQEIRRN